MRKSILKWLLLLLAVWAGVPLAAQAQTPSAIPAPTQSDLNRNLTRLAENPRDIDALIGAGEAALRLKDPRAATGFFARADEIDPANGRVKAGLARAMLGVQQPGEALRLFQEAERLGATNSLTTGDRAFAYDLMGNQVRAQADYAAAHRADPADADITRRYAVSLGISGKVQEAGKLLDPLLYQSDREAWRDRAFIYAINGDLVEARKITQATMPAQMASAVDPYLQRMTLLTPAQQVAAVHFGQFPGNVMAMAPKPFVAKPPQLASSGGGAGNRETVARPIREPIDISLPSRTAEARTPVMASRPEIEAALAASARPAPNARVATPVLSLPTQPSPGFQSMAPTPTPARPALAVPASPVVIQPPPTRIAALAPAARPQTVDRTLADIFADIQVPPEERAVHVTPVNLNEITVLQAAKRKQEAAEAAKAKADAAATRAKLEAKAKAEAEAKAKAREEAEAKAKAKANPARIWVQIATGRDPDALASDMRKRRKTQGSTFAGKTVWTSDFGATNRLVVGPFASAAKARAWLLDWRKAGGEGGYVWSSEKGMEVTKLSEK